MMIIFSLKPVTKRHRVFNVSRTMMHRFKSLKFFKAHSYFVASAYKQFIFSSKKQLFFILSYVHFYYDRNKSTTTLCMC